jgi:hypothetical protein
MTFDNSRTIISSRVLLFVATFPLLGFLVIVYVAKVIKFPLLGLSETIWVASLSAIYIYIAYFPTLLKYNYIYFSDDGKAIILRYYSAGIIKGTRHSVEIEKGSFAGYSTGSLFLGIWPYLILHQKHQGKTVKYPLVYISALKKIERNKIFMALEKYGHKS